MDRNAVGVLDLVKPLYREVCLRCLNVFDIVVEN
jgi:hypothetical protein